MTKDQQQRDIVTAAGDRVAAQQGISVDELKSRLRAVESRFGNDPNVCITCEGWLPAGHRGDKKTCSEACKKAANRAQNQKETS